MANEWLLLVGGGTAIATIASCWRQAKGIALYFWSFVAVTFDTSEPGQTNAVLGYLQTSFPQSRFGPRLYTGWQMFVRPTRNREQVAMEVLGRGFRVFWKGWLPLLVSRSGDNSGGPSIEVSSRPVRVTYIRGTLDSDQFVVEATDWYNRLTHNNSCIGGRRFEIVHVSGTAGKLIQHSYSQEGRGDRPTVGGNAIRHDIEALLGYRILKWTHADIGADITGDGFAIRKMALSLDVADAVEEIRVWLKSRKWHNEHGVPWSRKYGLTGAPGCGKTSFVRAVGEDFDLPIYSFDLPTLHNDELRREWSDMLRHTPCIALMDDMDRYFEDDSRKGPTIDCLLNCIDGVERTDGLLVFMAANRTEHLDDALGMKLDERGRPLRPGRVDRVLVFEPLSLEGRRHIANRILSDWPEVAEELVSSGEGSTGAQFENACAKIAVKLFWESQATALTQT